MSENNPQVMQQIGELMGFMRQQTNAYAAVLAKLEGISLGVAALRESNITFEGHRTRTHERFGDVSAITAKQSLDISALDARMRETEGQLASWRANLRLTMAIIAVVSTVMASTVSILSVVFGVPLVRTLFH